MQHSVKLIKNDRGSVIVVAMLLLVFLTIIGIAATNNSQIESNITRNSQIYRSDFYAADDGWRHAAMWIENFGIRPDTYNGTDDVVRYIADDDVAQRLDPPFPTTPPNTDSVAGSQTPYWFKMQHLEDAILPGNSAKCFNSQFKVTSYSGVDTDNPAQGGDTQRVEVRLTKAFCIN